GHRDALGNRVQDHSFRRQAAVALGRIGGKEALVELRASAVGDADEAVRKAAADAVKAIQGAGAEAADEVMGKVSGRVFYKGKPLPGGVVTFFPARGKPQAATIHDDGTYSVSVPVGEARVTVSSNPGAGKKQPIPVRYSNSETSSLKYIVKR